jgi:sporulation protein YlmC with PRC-barrel domain
MQVQTQQGDYVMKRNPESRTKYRAVITASLATCLYLSFASRLLAQQSLETSTTRASAANTNSIGTMNPARKCLSDLRAFDNQMQKSGYWISASGYCNGSPMYRYSSDETPALPHSAVSAASGVPAATSYWSARPAYEVRTLMTSANILARRGQQQACESLLATSRAIYKGYAPDMGNGHAPKVDVQDSDWRVHQVATAEPVISANRSFRSAQLIGTSVVSPQREDLGNVSDIVLSPQTGKVAYLVIGRGGLFGIDEKYVPVPWADFEATTGTTMLVLDTTKGKLNAAPEVKEGQFSSHGDFVQQSQKVDSYWKAHLSN